MRSLIIGGYAFAFQWRLLAQYPDGLILTDDRAVVAISLLA